MTARQVILLRHGLTDWNDSGRFQGQADVPLNEQGIAQAGQAAEALAEAGITRILSSDLSRAKTTAQIIGAKLGLSSTSDPRLQEVNVGSWAGLTAEEMAAKDPGFGTALTSGLDFRRSDTGETGTQAGRRVADALKDHAEAAASDDVLLVVGHGLASRVGTLLLIGLDYTHIRMFVGLGNCHWVVLKPGAKNWRMIGYNHRA